MSLKNTNGYTLVEVLVAISILLLAIVGPMTIAAKGVQGAYYARQQATALFLAQEGIEIIVASRNDALIKAIQENTSLSTAWENWTNAPMFVECRKNTGCNFALSDVGDGTLQKLYEENRFSVVSCSVLRDCRLKYDEGQPRARYTTTSGTDTEFTRVVKLIREPDLDSDPNNGGVFIEVTVSWSARIFAGKTQSIVLTSAVYQIYE